jgi:hypothetical protein
MHPIEITASYTEAVGAEARLLMRPKLFWTRTVFGNVYDLWIFLPVAVLGYLGITSLWLLASRPFAARDFLAWIGAVALVSLPLVFLGMIARGAILERRAEQATYGAVSFTLREDGILADVAPGLGEWSSYAGFCAGDHVIVLPKRNSKLYLRVPIDALSQDQRREVGGMLSAHLTKLTQKELRVRAWNT